MRSQSTTKSQVRTSPDPCLHLNIPAGSTAETATAVRHDDEQPGLLPDAVPLPLSFGSLNPPRQPSPQLLPAGWSWLQSEFDVEMDSGETDSPGEVAATTFDIYGDTDWLNGCSLGDVTSVAKSREVTETGCISVGDHPVGLVAPMHQSDPAMERSPVNNWPLDSGVIMLDQDDLFATAGETEEHVIPAPTLTTSFPHNLPDEFANPPSRAHITTGRPFTLSDCALETQGYLRQICRISPVIDVGDVRQRLLAGDSDQRFRTLVAALPIIDVTYQYQRQPSAAKRQRIVKLLTVVETSRLKSQFEDSPNLDSVITSFILFLGYITLCKRNRAFLCLSETISLFRMFSTQIERQSAPQDALLRRRLARLELIFFITERTSCAIYDYCCAHYANSERISESLTLLQETTPKDVSEAWTDQIVIQLAQIYKSAEETSWRLLEEEQRSYLASYMMSYLTSLSFDSCSTQGTGNDDLADLRWQTVDLIVTDSWRSIDKISATLQDKDKLNSPDPEPFQEQPLVRALLRKSSAALASICGLDGGLIRVIGLIKVAIMARDVARACYHVNHGGYLVEQCRNVVSGLVLAISREDYDESLAIHMQECVHFTNSSKIPTALVDPISYCDGNVAHECSRQGDDRPPQETELDLQSLETTSG